MIVWYEADLFCVLLQALRFVDRSNSMERARQLAIDYAGNAVAAALQLPDSPARSGLISLVDRVLNRER